MVEEIAADTGPKNSAQRLITTDRPSKITPGDSTTGYRIPTAAAKPNRSP